MRRSKSKTSLNSAAMPLSQPAMPRSESAAHTVRQCWSIKTPQIEIKLWEQQCREDSKLSRSLNSKGPTLSKQIGIFKIKWGFSKKFKLLVIYARIKSVRTNVAMIIGRFLKSEFSPKFPPNSDQRIPTKISIKGACERKTIK